VEIAQKNSLESVRQWGDFGRIQTDFIVCLCSYVSENLKHILVKLEDDVCYESEVDDHVDMLKSLYVNYKVNA
jgi:hypothetical protein